jgi:hypothetical protein
MRAAFGEVQVLCIHEGGKLVAGKPYGERSAFIVPVEDWKPRKSK